MQSEAVLQVLCMVHFSRVHLATTYTASQGLLLMIPNMYKIAGELFLLFSMFQHAVLLPRHFQYSVTTVM